MPSSSSSSSAARSILAALRAVPILGGAAGGADAATPERAHELERGCADAARDRRHQHLVAGGEPALQHQRVVGGNERFRHRGRLDERHSGGHAHQGARWNDRELGIGSAARDREDPIADPHVVRSRSE
jgi:hypothetical protein